MFVFPGFSSVRGVAGTPARADAFPASALEGAAAVAVADAAAVVAAAAAVVVGFVAVCCCLLSLFVFVDVCCRRRH